MRDRHRFTMISPHYEGAPPTDPNLTVHYTRLDDAGLAVWIHRADMLLGEITIDKDNEMTVTLGDKNSAPIFVYPPSALHRNKVQCEPQDSTRADAEFNPQAVPEVLLDAIADQAKIYCEQWIHDWIHADPEKLKQNIKWRVESLMIEKGLSFNKGEKT